MSPPLDSVRELSSRMSETEPSVHGSELNNKKIMLGATAITSDAAGQTAAKTDKMEAG